MSPIDPSNRSLVPADDPRASFVPPEADLLVRLRRAVPPHLFKRVTSRSLAYLAHDLVFVLLSFCFALSLEFYRPFLGLPSVLRILLWGIYCVFQGIFLTGIWVIAHECGHAAFSDLSVLNNVLGFFLHSFLLVPYFSWRTTHSQHHKSTNSMERDTVFVPVHEEHWKGHGSPFFDAPLVVLLRLFRMLLFGWPAYILVNVTAPRANPFASHFYPASYMFRTPRERRLVILSALGVFGMLALLAYVCCVFGISFVARVYGIPYLFVNMWLVIITFLQHTHPDLPHYRAPQFSFLRGSLATIDRDYGAFLNHFFHHIADSHVAHHLFSSMPHYHAVQATKHVKPVLHQTGMYHHDSTFVFTALWHAYQACQFVKPVSHPDILWYTNAVPKMSSMPQQG